MTSAISSNEYRAGQKNSKASRKAIEDISLFRNLEEDAVERLWQSATILNFPSGTSIVRCGSSGQSIYVLASGMARAEQRFDSNCDIHIATFHEGNFFGEQSLFSGSEIRGDVDAITDCEVIRLSKVGLKTVLEDYPSTMDHIARALAEGQVKRRALEADSKCESMGELESIFREKIQEVFEVSQKTLDFGKEARNIDNFHRKIA